MWVIAENGGLVNLNAYSLLTVTSAPGQSPRRFRVVAYTPQRASAIIASCDSPRQGYAIIRELGCRLLQKVPLADARLIAGAVRRAGEAARRAGAHEPGADRTPGKEEPR